MAHSLGMHIAVVFLVGIGIAAAVAVFAASKQSHSVKNDIVISHSAPDDDALL